MANPPRKKGTAGETAVVAWMREHGFAWADRQPLRGNRDAGDLTLCPGVIVEVKSYAGAPGRGQAPQAVLEAWMRQTETERENARADVGILIVKRNGTTDVGRWFAYVTAWTLAELVAGTTQGFASQALHAPVCLAVADLVGLLRAAGWGEQIEEAS